MKMPKVDPEALARMLVHRWLGAWNDYCLICEGPHAALRKQSETAKLPNPVAVVVFSDGEFRTTDDMAIVKSSDLTNLRDGVIRFFGDKVGIYDCIPHSFDND
jgi:hypothetical protein